MHVCRLVCVCVRAKYVMNSIKPAGRKKHPSPSTNIILVTSPPSSESELEEPLTLRLKEKPPLSSSCIFFFFFFLSSSLLLSLPHARTDGTEK